MIVILIPQTTMWPVQTLRQINQRIVPPAHILWVLYKYGLDVCRTGEVWADTHTYCLVFYIASYYVEIN